MNTISFNSRGTSKHTLLFVSLVLLIVFLFFSKYINVSSNFFKIPIMILWLPTMFKLFGSLTKDEKSFVRASVGLLIISLFYIIIGYSDTNRTIAFRVLTWLMTGMISVYAMLLFTDNEKKWLFSIITIVIILSTFFYIRSGYYLINYVEFTGDLATASTWFGSILILLTGVSLISFIYIKSWIPRVISIVIFIMTLYMTFTIMQRGTNVILTVAEIFIILLFNLKNKTVVWTFTGLIAILAILFVSSDFLIALLDWFAGVIPSQRVASRLNQLSTALMYNSIEAGGGSFSARYELIMTSWNTFTSSFIHFIFGAGEHWVTDTIIGHHSFMVDSLARYGIIGGALLFLYYKSQYWIMMSMLNKKTEWALLMQCSVVYFIYLFRNFYGNLTNANSSIVILLYFPLVFHIINCYKQAY